MRSSHLSTSPGLQPHRGCKEEGLHGPNHQFLDVGGIPPSCNVCKGNDGETSPRLRAAKGGWQRRWKEAAGLGRGVDLLWLRV